MTASNIAVVGGGASGMLAAGFCAKYGANTTIFEKNDRLGKKLGITGKGRCNVCNNCTRDTFIDNVITNPKFMLPSYSAFPSSAVMDFFSDRGVELKTERGNRVFPMSDKAGDIVNCLKSFCRDGGASVKNETVTKIEKNGDGFTVYTKNGEYRFDRVIIATGGVSYRSTGSTGDGYKFAKALGHTVIQPTPSLVPLVCREDCCRRLMGLSLKNVKLTVKDGEKTVFSEQGEMLFTHFGISGPLVLSASARLKPMHDGKYKAFIDFKPALDEKELDNRLLRDFSKNLNRNFSNSLSELLPSKFIPIAVEHSRIPPDTKVNSVNREMRKALLKTLKEFPLTVTGYGDINEAIITSGGVDVKQINPKTMESKICPGVYFAGEVIDCDAYTGGFNLQIAFSTAYAAARAAANITSEKRHNAEKTY